MPCVVELHLNDVCLEQLVPGSSYRALVSSYKISPRVQRLAKTCWPSNVVEDYRWELKWAYLWALVSWDARRTPSDRCWYIASARETDSLPCAWAHTCFR